MLFSPALHGTLGVWDEIIFAAGFVISVIIFIALALSDKKRNPKEETQNEDDDD
jgi:hypothetical protein